MGGEVIEFGTRLDCVRRCLTMPRIERFRIPYLNGYHPSQTVVAT